MDRINKIRKLMKKENLDCFLIHGGEGMGFNRFWAFGLDSSAGFGIVTHDKSIFLIDGRYIEVAEKTIKNAEVRLLKSFGQLEEELVNIKGKRIGLESEYTTLNFYDKLNKSIISKEFIITDTNSLRLKKDASEIKLMKEACRITEEVIEVVQNSIKPGMTETEVKQMLMIEHIKRGTDGVEFEIVASGARGALPHGRASNKIIEDGDMITIDTGTKWKGYCSDITRTFVVGDKCKHEQLVEAYEVVKEAQRLGVESIKPGIFTGDVDKACRDYINSKGYGKYFTHSTGHGLGIELHEFPSVSPNSKTILEPGMVITVEPGIYISGMGGIRIEDDVLVTESGYEVLNKSSKELKYIKN